MGRAAPTCRSRDLCACTHAQLPGPSLPTPPNLTPHHTTPRRCAAVVAWLESMADDALTGGEQGGAGGPLFAEHEGVWLETKHRLGTGGWGGRWVLGAP